MNREDIIRMAREAGLNDEVLVPWAFEIERFAKLVRDDYSTTHANLWLDRVHKFMLMEREACAKLCESEGIRIDASYLSCAEAIRARGEASIKGQA